jgi:hypothetical protein
MDRKFQHVEQVVLQEGLGEQTVAEDQEIATWLLFELRHFGSDVASNEGGVVPIDFLQRRRAKGSAANSVQRRGADPACLGDVNHDPIGAVIFHFDVAAVAGALTHAEGLVHVMARAGAGGV